MDGGMPLGSWRDSARSAKFFIFNAVTVIPVLWFLFNISLFNMLLVGIFVSFFVVLEYYGLTPRIFARFLRSFVAGKRKISSPWWV